jgi:hypothetical protein
MASDKLCTKMFIDHERERSMIERDTMTSSRAELWHQANIDPREEMQGDSSSEAGGATDGAPFFPVTGSVTFQPMAAAPKREAWHLPFGMARLVSAIGLSAVLLLPLSGCDLFDDSCTKSSTISSGSGQSGIGTSNSDCDGSHFGG